MSGALFCCKMSSMFRRHVGAIEEVREDDDFPQVAKKYALHIGVRIEALALFLFSTLCSIPLALYDAASLKERQVKKRRAIESRSSERVDFCMRSIFLSLPMYLSSVVAPTSASDYFHPNIEYGFARMLTSLPRDWRGLSSSLKYKAGDIEVKEWRDTLAAQYLEDQDFRNLTLKSFDIQRFEFASFHQAFKNLVMKECRVSEEELEDLEDIGEGSECRDRQLEEDFLSMLTDAMEDAKKGFITNRVYTEDEIDSTGPTYEAIIDSAFFRLLSHTECDSVRKRLTIRYKEDNIEIQASSNVCNIYPLFFKLSQRIQKLNETENLLLEDLFLHKTEVDVRKEFPSIAFVYNRIISDLRRQLFELKLIRTEYAREIRPFSVFE